MTSEITEYVIGIDVGTSSVRAALVTKLGKVVKVSSQPIKIWNPKPNFYHESSENIWSACCTLVELITCGIPKEQIKGIGFDATCSLVILNTEGKPLSIDPQGDAEQNVIVWLDHRAMTETEFINKTKHRALKFTGGKISCEMAMAKLLWLKRNMHEQCWKKAGYFMLLPDFLTWKATSCESRSVCTSLSKCAYMSSPKGYNGWNEEFIKLIGMEELSENNWKRIGSRTIKPGEKCGTITKEAAIQLGLTPEIVVGSSFVDAHAGGLALMGCSAIGIEKDFTKKIALVCGTSTCHMAVSNKELFIPGMWGPYYDAMIPDTWLIAGGQSASGKLIDHIIDTHVATSIIKQNNILNIMEYLNQLLYKMAKIYNLQSVDELTKSIHVYPDFHGNRSPISDPTLKGMISGLTLSSDEEDLALLYLATLQALVYGTRHILDEMKKGGHKSVKSILFCGGLSKNTLFLQLHANAIGLPVLRPKEPEMVLVGAAMLGASAAKLYPTLKDTVFAMAGPATYIEPVPQLLKYHDKKYKVFLQMLNNQRQYDNIMEGK